MAIGEILRERQFVNLSQNLIIQVKESKARKKLYRLYFHNLRRPKKCEDCILKNW